jgi:uncharacterized protein (DUF302 family)
MLYSVDTKKTIQDAGRDLEAAILKHRFGVMGVHNLREAMKSKGVDFDGSSLVYEVCNPQQAKKILESHPELSTALPCRISIYEVKGKVRLSTVKPSTLIRMYDAADLVQVAADIEETIIAIMNEAAAER